MTFTEKVRHCHQAELWKKQLRRGRKQIEGLAIAQAVSRRLGFQPRSGHVGFMLDKVALGKVFSEYFGFSYQLLLRQILHNHHLSSGAGT
jgi:hypothetical protein